MEHRPYSRDATAPPSVTTIIDLLAKPGLAWGAANETAQYAVHNSHWCLKPDHEAVQVLRKHHRGVWDHRALVGTAVHNLNSQWACGESADVRDLIVDMRSRSTLWARQDVDDIYTNLKPFIAGLTAAWVELEPQTLDVDGIVRHPAKGVDYIGTFDWIIEYAGRQWLVDLKTTARSADKFKPYWDSWRLQLAAYKFATERVTYADGKVDTVTPLDDDRDLATAVLLLCGDGSWQWLPCGATEDDWEVFLQLRKAYGWRITEGQWAGVDSWVDVRTEQAWM